MTFETRPGIFALKAQAQRKSGPLAATLLASALAACSSVPDAVNPIEWYKGTRDYIAGEDGAKANEKAPAANTAARKEEAGEFPSLSSVPERPAVTPENQRALAAKGLAADSERAKYSDEEIRRDTGAATARPAGVSAPITSAPIQAAGTSPAPMGAAPARQPAVAPPSSQPLSAQEMFQRRIAEQNSPKLTPEMMMQGFFTGPGPAPSAPSPMASAGSMAPAPAGSVPKSQMLGSAAVAAIPFESGSAELSAAAQSQLRQLAQTAIAQNKRIRIAGHSANRMTDQAGGMGDISGVRANAVARAIIGLGVPPGAVTVMALADTQPVSNVEAANRRVEIFFE
ncbi:putative OmpA/MotB protein [Rhodospirillaceae bacterium LM-1]|nr:putative OmpA/MotB protein [Rhodospirillaceae bacterium LM-1]